MDDLAFSTVYGGGIYRWSGDLVPDPIMGGDDLSPLLTSILSGETYFLRRLDCPSEKALDLIRRRILTPPSRENILWPSDLVFLPESRRESCTVFAMRQYTDTPLQPDKRPGDWALLFPWGGYPPLIGGERRLQELREHSRFGWRESAVRETAAAILQALADLNRGGYAYEEIHPARFLFREDGSVFLDYSMLLSPVPRGISDAGIWNPHTAQGAREYCAPADGEYPLEFAEPAFLREERKQRKYLDFRSQNYSITAMLFYLFFGRYPYDGRLLSDYVDDGTPRKHYIKFRDYHRMPVFLFDPNDDTNHLGAFTEEQKVLELWENCPERLRTIFQSALCEASALRESSMEPPSPKRWLAELKAVEWIKTTKTGTEGIA